MPAYLDHASTTPPHPAARAALLAALDEGWADPARLYREGRRARMLLDAARETVAGVLGARADEVSFCASGTVAAHLAVLGTAAARRRAGDLVLVSAVEHSSVLHAAERHERAGGRTHTVGVDGYGRVDPAGFTPPPGTALVSLQHANHEVGTVQPLAAVTEVAHAAGVPVHTDAAMTVGQLPVDVGELGVDLLTASGHKFGGPPGVGILVVRSGTRWANPMPADERESGRAPGFPNLPAIVAAAAALHARAGELAAERERLGALTARLRARLPELVDDVELLGDPDPAGRLPHLVAFSCLYVAGEALLGELDRAGIAVSSGSSCTSDTLTPSHVLVAMGALSHGNIRVSFGRGSTEADLSALLDVVPGAVTAIRERAGAVGL
ncbi:cysteine desulfurase [Frankia sp. CNm7]|uniref:cysteine desulfurase n=1 Tax=Frankia nepalensis TaxID=1836974 RepID=A0A937UVU8_9ACTN|nr:cysteine desulfurase family protein [Frankia nepalensis]MBL7500673.1 cysteine desulfurase [Frankia nepalensis]MBL7513141.1 cysteine desulfurase [Frankia nepalensis]MBL7522115.1 cysteine desulfurase [Frankia nepalensis]MBL7633585.1 cysteine desulfurase [Frankia nepalensis]